MEKNLELLKNLINGINISPQSKLNIIIQTLQKTDDIMKSKMLSEKVLTGDFTGLKKSAIENLIEAFSKLEKTNDKKDDKTLLLENELKLMKKRMSELENKHKIQIQKLKDENVKLESVLFLTKTTTLIEISDEDINELYIRYLKTGEITYKGAFISENIIPKSYYKIK